MKIIVVTLMLVIIGTPRLLWRRGGAPRGPDAAVAGGKQLLR